MNALSPCSRAVRTRPSLRGEFPLAGPPINGAPASASGVRGRGLSPPRRSAAFSLIEVLVVIAIITLLLAVLLPSLSAARAQAKRAVCASNLKTIASAWHTYLNQNGDRFPQWVDININFGGCQGALWAFGGGGHGVPKILNPELGLKEVAYDGCDVFRCPADKGGNLAPESYYVTYGNSYATNTLLIGQDQLYTPPFGPCRQLMEQVNRQLPDLNRSRISNDSKLLLMGDAGWVNTWHPGSSKRIEWHGRPRSHNLAFMDGHVEFLRIRKGLHVTPEYSVIPFDNLISSAQACQQEVGGG